MKTKRILAADHRDGKVVGDSKPGGFFFVDTKKKLTFTLDRGQTRMIAGRIYPELVDDSTGASELKEMSYIGTALAR